MSVELGSIWIDNDSDLLVIVKSLEGNCEGRVKVVYNYIVRAGSGCFEATSGLDLFLNTKTKLVRNDEGDYSKGYEHGVQHTKMQDSIDKYLDISVKLSLTEDEVDNIIDGAFEEGYAQAYSEIQAKTEREQALQERAWDEGYDQAIDDLIEAGVIGEEEYLDDDCSDEDYSEYEFGDIEDDEEEYCFSKELDKILKSGQEQYEADPSVPSMGNRYDENGNLCGFFINTGNEKTSGNKGSERKHSHYFKDVRHLDYVDVYQVCKLFPVDDDSGAITHARKKLLVAGGRGAGKDMIKDITEARDTLNRYLQIEGIE